MANPEAGANCQLLVIVLVRARGYEFPPLRSAELFADKEFTKVIPDIAKAESGDIIGLTRKNQTDSRWFHVGMLFKDEQGEWHLTHNARHTGFAQTQTLEEAMRHPLHELIAEIRRPVVRNTALLNPAFLETYGFGHLTTAV
ncbi:MAG: hypothetical protein M1444_02560 [Patescibacteria group bacterium]|nr:hypothetical protein [Patescibacteria group bacterium]